MTSLKRMLAGGGAVLLGGIVYTAATAQGFYSHRTYFTFSRSVELPGGSTLRPGKYVFRLADSSANRHLVQVLNEHETKMFATLLAVEPSDEAVVMFGEIPANAPQPIRYWYHAGRTVGGPIGYEFVYPQDQATRIAHATKQHVLMTDAPLYDAHPMTRAQVRTVDPNGATAVYRETVRPQVRSIAPAATNWEQKTPVRERLGVARTELPEMAGVQSLTLIGLSLLGGAAVVALRVHQRASSRPAVRRRRLI